MTDDLDTWKPGMIMWFGESWDAPLNESCRRTATPVGELCMYCADEIREGTQGIMIMDGTQEPSAVAGKPWGFYRPVHRPCSMESILGPNWRDILPQEYIDDLENTGNRNV